jgi:hypothetical protein
MSVASGSELPLKGFQRTLVQQLGGFGYEEGDLYGEFLPPPGEVNADGDGESMRAVVIVTEETQKGTARSPQEYVNPLLVVSGRDYASISFVELHERICDALRGKNEFVGSGLYFCCFAGGQI